jgi:N-acetyl sugar amidotransferase
MASTDNAVKRTVRLRPPTRDGQVCTQCVMDTSDPQILFDDEGVCNHCHDYRRRMREDVPTAGRQAYLETLLSKIREAGKGHEYDCVLGMSGGVDSTYVAWLCKKEYGLRPLAVHFDNGWNTELAVQNIEVILRALDIDLYTHVVDWEEFSDLQRSFLKSSISNWELPTDHAIRALLYREAARRGIKYILTGSNLVTEAVMPSSWLADNIDLRLLRSIHSRFGTRKLRSYPQLSLRQLAWDTFARGIRQIPILNYADYHKDQAMALLERELSWRPYAFKHGESLFTRFFQRYYLPHKFGYDKRKPHLSNLILSGQTTRNEALAELNKPLYYPEELERDVAYVTKKLDLSRDEFTRYVEAPPKGEHDYPNSGWVQRKLPWLVALSKRVATSRRFGRAASPTGSINLHIYPSPIGRESRIFRVTEALARWGLFDRIVVVGMQSADLPPQQRIDERREIVRVRTLFADSRSLPRRLARFVSWYVGVIAHFRREPIACVNCHSLSTLPLGWFLKVLTGAKLIYDAHELETETLNMRGVRRKMAKLTEALFIRTADATIVVGSMIADWYRRRYPGLEPTVVRNLPETEYSEVRYNLFRERLGIPQESLLFFYQGVLAEARGIETILSAFARLNDGPHVVFLGYGPMSTLIEEHAQRHASIHCLPAVLPSELRKYTQSGDIGLCLIEPNCLSYTYSMPNKLFEYLGSGVPAIVTNLPELSKIIATSGAGWAVANDADALLKLIESIPRDDARRRGLKGVQWTRDNSWQSECEVLKTVYDRLGFSASRSVPAMAPVEAPQYAQS